VFAADLGNRRVVWVETTATDLFTFPWVMYSHDLRSGRTLRVAQPPDVGVTPVPAAPDGTAPHLAGDRVYFAAVRAVRNGRAVPAVYSAPLDGSGVLRMEAPNGFGGAISGGDLIYQTAQPGSFRRWAIHVQALRNGENTVLAHDRSSRFSGLAAADGAVMWQTLKGRTCLLQLRTADGATHQIQQGSCDTDFAYLLPARHRVVLHLLPAGREVRLPGQAVRPGNRPARHRHQQPRPGLGPRPGTVPGVDAVDG
jgi:hypothetical protein